MSNTTNDQESELTASSGETSRPRLRPRRATVSEQSATSKGGDGGEDAAAGLALPFLARVSKGRLNVSEASIPAPQSSDVLAQGQVFTPPHLVADEVNAFQDEDSISPTPTTINLEDSAAANSASASPAIVNQLDSTSTATFETEPLKSDRNENQQQAVVVPTDPGLVLASSSAPPSRSDPALNQASGSLATDRPFDTSDLPEIRVHRPSGTIITTMSSPVVPPTPPPTTIAQSPGANAFPFTNSAPLPAGLPNIAAAADALPLTALPPITQTALPGLSRKTRRRTKMVRKVRKTVVRKKLLSLLIGRNLANVVHPVLAKASPDIPVGFLSLDGASDSRRGSTRNSEEAVL
ncbi:hypothetical protein PV08_11119 [Exophiala spinifera]|uniref:Uncharacterized protein n=1 Tax=Exophiala spinifera TaxID=91928 RepID=A0A0D2ATU6_9EURO|nr:uncharacterized protein PV08_11119 [Exophiala spinifera]KIW10158.1 hypothetical protein PV08_11119 [Exophiala spinifera]